VVGVVLVPVDAEELNAPAVDQQTSIFDFDRSKADLAAFGLDDVPLASLSVSSSVYRLGNSADQFFTSATSPPLGKFDVVPLRILLIDDARTSLLSGLSKIGCC